MSAQNKKTYSLQQQEEILVLCEGQTTLRDAIIQSLPETEFSALFDAHIKRLDDEDETAFVTSKPFQCGTQNVQFYSVVLTKKTHLRFAA